MGNPFRTESGTLRLGRIIAAVLAGLALIAGAVIGVNLPPDAPTAQPTTSAQPTFTPLPEPAAPAPCPQGQQRRPINAEAWVDFRHPEGPWYNVLTVDTRNGLQLKSYPGNIDPSTQVQLTVDTNVDGTYSVTLMADVPIVAYGGDASKGLAPANTVTSQTVPLSAIPADTEMVTFYAWVQADSFPSATPRCTS